MKKYECEVCGYIYDPAVGDPEHNIDWECPLCNVGKDQFKEIQ